MHHNDSVVKEFRAQRNFYITGFALFLWLVIKQLIELILYKAKDLKIIETKDKSIEELNKRVALKDTEIKILKEEYKTLEDTIETNNINKEKLENLEENKEGNEE